jgi:hypothetical protein
MPSGYGEEGIAPLHSVDRSRRRALNRDSESLAGIDPVGVDDAIGAGYRLYAGAIPPSDGIYRLPWLNDMDDWLDLWRRSPNGGCSTRKNNNQSDEEREPSKRHHIQIIVDF